MPDSGTIVLSERTDRKGRAEPIGRDRRAIIHLPITIARHDFIRAVHLA